MLLQIPLLGSKTWAANVGPLCVGPPNSKTLKGPQFPLAMPLPTPLAPSTLLQPGLPAFAEFHRYTAPQPKRSWHELLPATTPNSPQPLALAWVCCRRKAGVCPAPRYVFRAAML